MINVISFSCPAGSLLLQGSAVLEHHLNNVKCPSFVVA